MPIILETPPPLPLTIYIHGTQRTATAWIPKTTTWAYNFTHYKKGLHRALDIPHDYIYSHVVRHISEGDSKKFPLEHCYVFCWSGKLSHEARLEAAKELHVSLQELLKQFPQPPFITIITHSHGGNVALNIMNLPDKKEYAINRLIMLANPVQQTTQACAEDSTVFKEILAPHSHGDLFQVAAPQQNPTNSIVFDRSFFTDPEKIKVFLLSCLPPFSQRHFPKNSRVKEIAITYKKRPISHLGFMLPSFTTQLGTILDKLETHNFATGEMEYDLPRYSKSDFLQFLK